MTRKILGQNTLGVAFYELGIIHIPLMVPVYGSKCRQIRLNTTSLQQIISRRKSEKRGGTEREREKAHTLTCLSAAAVLLQLQIWLP